MTVYAPTPEQQYGDADAVDNDHLDWVMESVCVLSCCARLHMSVSAACVHWWQAEWLTDGTIPLDKDIVLLATSGGNPVCGWLAEHLIKKGAKVKGIVAMSGTSDPMQV